MRFAGASSLRPGLRLLTISRAELSLADRGSEQHLTRTFIRCAYIERMRSGVLWFGASVVVAVGLVACGGSEAADCVDAVGFDGETYVDIDDVPDYRAIGDRRIVANLSLATWPS